VLAYYSQSKSHGALVDGGGCGGVQALGGDGGVAAAHRALSEIVALGGWSFLVFPLTIFIKTKCQSLPATRRKRHARGCASLFCTLLNDSPQHGFVEHFGKRSVFIF
jgi:hypothetical protein